ncbi:MAG: ParA family protein [Terriglobales bacterium]
MIPSRLELSHTLKNPTGKERRLAKALAKVADEYDLILIDCAPTESILTEAAYHASRYVLVPVKPEFLATIGLPLLARSIQEFKFENADHELDICGIVFNHSSTYSNGPEGRKSVKEVQAEAKKHGWNVFNTHVRYSASYAKAAREGTPLSSTSYVRWPVTSEFGQFVDEFLAAIKMSKA